MKKYLITTIASVIATGIYAVTAYVRTNQFDLLAYLIFFVVFWLVSFFVLRFFIKKL